MAGLNIGFSIAGGWLCDRTGPMVIGVAGLVVLAAGLFVMGFLHGQSTLGQVAASIALVGGGMGLFQSSAYALMMGSVPPERFGTAAAMLSLSQASGTVLSVAVTGGLFALSSGIHLGGLAGGRADGGGDGGEGLHPGLPRRFLAGGGDSVGVGVHLPAGAP